MIASRWSAMALSLTLLRERLPRIWSQKLAIWFVMWITDFGHAFSQVSVPRWNRLFGLRHQRCVATGRGRIDGHGLFGRKTRQIMRPAGLWAGAGKPMATERLHADHRANHVAVDIDVADREGVDHALDRIVDAGVDAEGQPEACALDRLQHTLEIFGAVTHHVQDGSGHFLGQLI